MQLNTHLNFNGQCEEAFQFYQKSLGGIIAAMVRHEGTPAAEHVPAEWRQKIMHAELKLEGQILMGADAPPNRYRPPQGFAVTIQTQQSAEADRIFRSLAENGEVQMPIQETFWAARFGMLVDRFGIPWMVNCPKAS
ncbi:MAG TPA: VOC family protein [Bryobacteraceae bacterium]|nr:VOC family protein [Bryobacteraceae bacterium]